MRHEMGIAQQSLVSRLKSQMNLMATRRRAIAFDAENYNEFTKLYDDAVKLSDQIHKLTGKDYWV